jgi:flavin-binding protein dodecin
MNHDVFKIIELAGTSSQSVEDAIQTAIQRASKTIRGMSWFEVTQTRGRIENGQIVEYQVAIKVGFKLDGQ